jgi:hypothetical protein
MDMEEDMKSVKDCYYDVIFESDKTWSKHSLKIFFSMKLFIASRLESIKYLTVMCLLVRIYILSCVAIKEPRGH